MRKILSLFNKTLKEPLEVVTFNIENHYYASSGTYNIYVNSSSEDNAMDSFIEQLEDMYTRYSKLTELMQ